MIGVYIIKNIKNGFSYIGSSKMIESRITEHFWNLGYNTHYNYRMQRDYLIDYRYFVWGIYKEFDSDTDYWKVYETEQLLLDTIHDKYNILLGARDHLHYKRDNNKITKTRQLKFKF